ncbi:MAG: hypothetical protein O3A93_09215 [Chloroflexi bacterium]|nr:hypothetical protein [Chloroflexota bacterium]MDA1271426.1 hypothetical protein [Chloroflexota bacterium]PKB58965.1 MAG: hypothetical protein BZY83_04240 [SAR202 cluster bacterium Casp-Chloro-G2]
MIIKVEPADMFMYTVIMISNLETPDPEDQEIRDYMEAEELEPKYRSEGDFEGRHSESMQFGGCYLGRHLGEINLIQQKYIEVELITHEIKRHLGESDRPVELPDEKQDAAVAELLKSFNNDKAFREREDGKYEVALDGEAVREAARALLKN